MQRLDEILVRRSLIAGSYEERLRDIAEVMTPLVRPGVTRMSWQVYVVQLSDEIDRDAVMQYLTEQGIGCRPYFTPIHLQPCYAQEFGYRPGDFPIAERLGRQSLALPFFNRISEAQLDCVVEKLSRACRRFCRTASRVFVPDEFRAGRDRSGLRVSRPAACAESS